MEFVDNDALDFFMTCASFSELHQKTFDASMFYDDPLAVFMPLSPPMSIHSPSSPPSTATHALTSPPPLTRPEPEQKQKKPRRRVRDLPYAPNLLNLDLSTTTPTPARPARSQTAKKQTILHNLARPGSPSSSAITAYKCDFEGCQKTFTRPYNLKSHRRTHTLERPYACHLCPKEFARQHDRNRHTKLHYGIKPYVCSICTKAFARQDALNRHQRPDNPEASCASIGNHRIRSKRARKRYSE